MKGFISQGGGWWFVWSGLGVRGFLRGGWGLIWWWEGGEGAVGAGEVPAIFWCLGEAYFLCEWEGCGEGARKRGRGRRRGRGRQSPSVSSNEEGKQQRFMPDGVDKFLRSA